MQELLQLKSGNKSKLKTYNVLYSLGEKLEEKFTQEDREAREMRIQKALDK